MLHNSKTQIVTKLKPQIVTKLKDSNGDKTLKLKLWQNSKIWIVAEIKQKPIVKKLKNQNCDKIQTIKLGQN